MVVVHGKSTSFQKILRRQRAILALASATMLYGCAAGPDAASAPDQAAQPVQPALARQSPGNPIVAESSLRTGDANQGVIDARPAAIVNGRMVNWADLRPTLNELAGADALQETILDRTVEAALQAGGVQIGPDDVAAERKLLLESLNDDPDVAVRLLDELRSRQKLGKVRFDALMRRNAGLRALVRGQVRTSSEAVQDMYEMLHGPKRQPRLMTLANLETAQAAINLVKSGIPFGDVATEMSTDSSAARGGLLEPVSRVDPSYPQALRQTLWTLNPGEMSGPILLDDHYAVLMLVKRVAGDGISLEECRPSVERQVRVTQERLLMDQLARRMLQESSVKVFDDQLNEAWERRQRPGQ